MRLLTKEEIGTVTRYGLISYMSEYLKIAKAQRDLTHKETLKAVGKIFYANCIDSEWCDRAIEALKRGEMPEEVK